MWVSFRRILMIPGLAFFCLVGLRAEPFTLASGQLIEAREVRRVRGVVEWVNPVGRVTISTPWGRVSAVGTIYLYPSGAVKQISLGWGESDVVELTTPYGNFFIRDDLTFHPNGQIASVKLKNLTPVSTPVGTVSTLSLSFHPGGELQSVFIPSWRPALVTLNGSRLQVRDGLTFHPDGKVAEAIFLQPDQAFLETPAGQAAVSRVKFHENGRFHSVNFSSEETRILGHRCRSASWYPNGQLASLELVETVAMETPFGNRRVSGLVEWHENGRPKFFRFEESLPAHNLSQLGRLTLRNATFDDKGALIEAGLEKIQPITTALGRVETDYIHFFPNGNLRSLSLGKNGKEFAIQTPVGVLSAGWFLSFYEDGQLRELSFKPLTVHSVRTPLGTLPCTDSVQFYPSGALSIIHLSTARRLSTPLGMLTMDNEVEFYESGAIKRCRLRGELQEKLTTPLGELSGWEVSFYPKGSIEELTLAQPFVWKENPTGEWWRLRFSETGNLVDILPPKAN
jgi:antitoxin component YwqK of YwqJK toxin-antitoxin module